VGFFIFTYLFVQESDFQSTTTHSFFSAGGYMYKIPDPSLAELESGFALKRPFDAFGVIEGEPYFTELKFQQGYSAFAFSKIEDHQIWHLSNARPAFQDKGFCGIILAIWLRNQFYDVFFFDINYINQRIQNGDKSIKKKELEKFKKSGMCLFIKNGLFDVRRIKELAFHGNP
jgi:penicillin-binding protein-related factor A (putative recombinase)